MLYTVLNCDSRVMSIIQDTEGRTKAEVEEIVKASAIEAKKAHHSKWREAFQDAIHEFGGFTIMGFRSISTDL